MSDAASIPDDFRRQSRRYSVLATLTLLLIFSLILTGSLENYVANYPPAERNSVLASIHNAAAPFLKALHRYGGFLLVFLAPATALPLLKLGKHLPERKGTLRGTAVAIMVTGLGSVVFGLVTGHLIQRTPTTTPLAANTPETTRVDELLSLHFTEVSLSLALVTVVIVWGTLQFALAKKQLTREAQDSSKV